MDFERVYRSYFRDVFLYLCSLSMNQDIAEELAQETFVKALRSIDTFDGSRDIRAWLFTIAKNTYYTWCRRRKIYAPEEPPSDTASPQPDLAERFADEESAFLIHQLNVIFFCYYVSVWSKYVESAFAGQDRYAENEEGVLLGAKSEIDQIYYGEFEEYMDPRGWWRAPDLGELAKGMELVWESNKK